MNDGLKKRYGGMSASVGKILGDGYRRCSRWGLFPAFNFYWNVRYKNNYLQNRKRELSFPHMVMMEVTNRCNIKCVMCPREIMTRDVGDMSISLYRIVLNEIQKYGCTDYLVLHYSGEPTLNKDLVSMVRYAKDEGVGFVKFNTNGLLVKGNLAKDLIESGLDLIVFAVESSRAIHDKFRVGSDYDMVNENIFNLMKLKKQLGCGRPAVSVQMLVTNDMEEEVLESAKRFWKPKVDFVDVRSISTVGGQVEDKGTVRSPEKFCRQVYTVAGVLWNGDVVPCCVDHDANLMMGNVKDNTLHEIWNSKKYKEFRMKHRNGDIEDLSFCKRCLDG